MNEQLLGKLRDNRYHATEWEFCGGITIRDYLAAQAMQGIIAECVKTGLSVDQIAENAYAAADAMLRVKHNEKV